MCGLAATLKSKKDRSNELEWKEVITKGGGNAICNCWYTLFSLV
jgi:hypothetical protein